MFRVSCIQMCSSDCIESNLNRSERLIKKAVKQKANLIITPEVSSKFSLNSYEDKRPLMDMATDFNTKHFWQNKKSRLQFIYLVLFSYQTMLQQMYRKSTKLNEQSHY